MVETKLSFAIFQICSKAAGRANPRATACSKNLKSFIQSHRLAPPWPARGAWCVRPLMGEPPAVAADWHGGSLVDKFIAGLRVLDYAPELEMFAERNGGMVILFNLPLAGPADSPFPQPRRCRYPSMRGRRRFRYRASMCRRCCAMPRRCTCLAVWRTTRSRSCHVPRDALEMPFATMFLYLARCAEDGLGAAVMPNRTILATV